MKPKKTIYVEKTLGRDEFRVVRVRNGVSPEVGTVLCGREIDRYIHDCVEVIVDLPRARRE